MKEVQDYVRDKDYTYDIEKPGLCFCFEILKNSDTRFDVTLMFND
jgi:hypothetical protein